MPEPSRPGPAPRRTGLRLWLLLGACVVVVIVIAGFKEGSSGPKSATLRQDFVLSVDRASWAKVQAFVRGPQNRWIPSARKRAFTSGAALIWGYVCEDDLAFAGPIPTRLGSTSAGVEFRLRMSASKAARAENALKSQSCGLSYGLYTIQQDYEWAASPRNVDESLVAAAQRARLLAVSG